MGLTWFPMGSRSTFSDGSHTVLTWFPQGPTRVPHGIHKVPTCVPCGSHVGFFSRVTSAIINSCNTKEKLYNRLKHNPDNYELKNKYKTFCKNLTNVIKAAKTKYDKSLIEKKKKNSSDPRKLWACINNKIGRNKNKSDTTIKQIKTESNTIIKNKTEIANIMNTYYCNLGETLINRIITPNKEIELPKSNPNTLFINPTNIYEIIKIIDNLKFKKAGVDNINAKTLKTISHHIADTLVYTFNLCIEMAIWPDALMSAETIPIYKAGSKNEMTNYRPISLISNIAKII